MKFGEILKEHIDENHKDFYLEYDNLKVILESVKERKLGYKQQFMTILEREFLKITTYIENWKNNLRINNSKVEWIDLISLNSFIFINMEGLRKIIKKYDKTTGEKIGSYWHPKIRHNFEKTIINFAAEWCLLTGSVVSSKFTSSTGRFVRKSEKYWINRWNIAKFIELLSSHMPFCKIDEEDTSPWSWVKSVYFDNKDNEVYSKRIRKLGKSKLIRLRWYNDNVSRVYLERKIHLDTWTGDESSKDRIQINQAMLNEILDKNIRETESSNELFREIFTEIKENNLVPMIKVEYLRIAFQNPEDNSIRFSLDTGMRICKVKFNHESMDKWYGNDEDLMENECIWFSKGIIEIKLSGDVIENPPLWISELKTSNWLELENNFSKFIHGTFCLSKSNTIERPEWLNRLDNEVLVNNNIIENKNNCSCLIFPKRSTGSVKIEPKVFFANERTFITWLTIIIFLISFGSTISALNQKAVGLSMQVSGVILLIYALYCFYDRDRKLRNRTSEGYSDRLGPILLTLCIMVVIIVSITQDYGKENLEY